MKAAAQQIVALAARLDQLYTQVNANTTVHRAVHPVVACHDGAIEEIRAAIAQIQEWLDSAANNRSTLETELRTTTRNIQETAAAVA